MTESSKEALIESRKTRSALKQKVYDFIKGSADGLTLYDLANCLSRPLNELSGRVSELYKSGKIKIDGTKRSPRTGRKMSVWVSKD
jgi:hypothetical protein